MGLVIGLLGVILGAAIALVGVQWQIQASAEQSHSNFLKEKRIDAYASWLDAINELAVKEEAAFDALDASSASGASAAAEVVAVREHLRRMESIEIQISIVGSDAVKKETQAMMAGHEELANQLALLQEKPTLAPSLHTPSTGEKAPETGGGSSHDDASANINRIVEELAAEQRKARDGSEEFQRLSDATEQSRQKIEELIKTIAALESSSRAFAVGTLEVVTIHYDAFVEAAQNDLEIGPL